MQAPDGAHDVGDRHHVTDASIPTTNVIGLAKFE